MVHVEHTHDLNSLFANPGLWDSLSRGVPFRETAWLKSWWQHLGNDQEPIVLIARDDGDQIVGLLPLYRLTRRTLRNLGDGNACSDHVSVLAPADRSESIGLAFGRYLASLSGSRQDGWETLELDGIVEHDPAMVAFAEGLRQAGAVIHTHSRMNTWFRPCDESWDAHLAKSSGRSRSRTRKLLGRCDPGGPLQISIAQSRDQVDHALAATIDLHQRRWEQVGQPGAFAEAVFRNFISEAVESFFHRGQLNLVTLHSEQRIIAGMINVQGQDRRLYVYNSGFDPAHEDLDPGIVLHLAVLRGAHEEGLEGIDYLRGDETYKSRIKALPKRLLQLRAVAPAWKPRLRHAAWITRFGLKQFVRKRTGRPLAEVVEL